MNSLFPHSRYNILTELQQIKSLCINGSRSSRNTPHGAASSIGRRQFRILVTIPHVGGQWTWCIQVHSGTHGPRHAPRSTEEVVLPTCEHNVDVYVQEGMTNCDRWRP